MECYMIDRADDVVVPNDQCARNNFPSKEKWKQWGLNTIDESNVSLNNSYSFGKSIADDGDLSYETLVDMNNLEMDCPVSDGDRLEVSDVPGSISESSNYWTSLLNNQDYQLDGFPWTDQIDENFLNMLLVDDSRASDQFHIYDSMNSQCTNSTENNLTSDVLLDSCEMESFEQTYSPKFHYASGWEIEEQADTSHYNLENMMISSGSQHSAPVEICGLQEVCGRRFVSENYLAEETVLQEFGSAVQKMTQESRLCFRDAMYRLATNSEKQGIKTAGKSEESSRYNNNLVLKEKDATEQRTNMIDRTIADLLFNKQYQDDECHQDLISAAKPHNKYPQKQLQLTMQPVFIRGR